MSPPKKRNVAKTPIEEEQSDDEESSSGSGSSEESKVLDMNTAKKQSK